MQLNVGLVIILAENPSLQNGALLKCIFRSSFMVVHMLVNEPATLPLYYLTRVGVFGQVGRFHRTNATQLSRRDQVVCRTARGLEVGTIMGPTVMGPSVVRDTVATSRTDHAQAGVGRVEEPVDGRIVRKMSTEDRLMWQQLQKLGAAAHSACEAWLRDNQIPAVLIEVEPLLDGKTLYFHFLSAVGIEVQQQLDELAAIYEKEVQQSKFARLLEHGCGPGCGTSSAVNGCSSRGGCAVCSIASK